MEYSSAGHRRQDKPVWTVLLLLCGSLLCGVEAEIRTGSARQLSGPEPGLEYAFRYQVDAGPRAEGAVSDRWEEKRHGVVRGAYSLLQPDGLVRTVDYQAQEPRRGARTLAERRGGLKAVVRYWPGPQKLLSAMMLSESMAKHPQPLVNTRAMQGKDYDAEQPARFHQSVEMFAGLRAELGLPPPTPHLAERRALPPPRLVEGARRPRRGREVTSNTPRLS